MLHITNGDCAGDSLKLSGLSGDVALSCDVLHNGPVLGFDAPQWLERYRDHEEVVLWFEHDLFDQLLLIRLLAWFGERETTLDRVKLICIGSFPGVEPFYGLGQLTPAQLASLFPSREPVTEQQLELGARAWKAFTSRDPRQVEQLASTGTPALPFLAGALVRQLEEFPSVRSGLSRTEQQALDGMASCATKAGSLFRAVQQMEERPFMGDWSFFEILEALSSGAVPLVQYTGRIALGPPWGTEPPDGSCELTGAGRDVLAGRADAVALRGIDRWIGGVHLRGAESPWRWDTGRRTLIRI